MIDPTLVVKETPAEELPALIGVLAQAQALAWARLTAPGLSSATDENLSADEAARRLGVSRDWLYKTPLPFKLKIGRRTVFSSAGLDRWNRQRMTR